MKVTSRLSPFLRVFPRLGVSSPIAHGHLIKSFADSVQVEVGALLLLSLPASFLARGMVDGAASAACLAFGRSTPPIRPGRSYVRLPAIRSNRKLRRSVPGEGRWRRQRCPQEGWSHRHILDVRRLPHRSWLAVRCRGYGRCSGRGTAPGVSAVTTVEFRRLCRRQMRAYRV